MLRNLKSPVYVVVIFMILTVFFWEIAGAVDLFPEDCERGRIGFSFDVSFDSSDAFIGGTVFFKNPKNILDEA